MTGNDKIPTAGASLFLKGFLAAARLLEPHLCPVALRPGSPVTAVDWSVVKERVSAGGFAAPKMLCTQEGKVASLKDSLVTYAFV